MFYKLGAWSVLDARHLRRFIFLWTGSSVLEKIYFSGYHLTFSLLLSVFTEGNHIS